MTISNVGELRKLLGLMSDETKVKLWENRYQGGGDESYECLAAFTITGDGDLIVSPEVDGSTMANEFDSEIIEYILE